MKNKKYIFKWKAMEIYEEKKVIALKVYALKKQRKE